MSTKDILVQMLYERDCELKLLRNQKRTLESQLDVVEHKLATTPAEKVYVSKNEVDDLINLVLHGRDMFSIIHAIKVYRRITNSGLKEAKDAVESYEQKGSNLRNANDSTTS